MNPEREYESQEIWAEHAQLLEYELTLGVSRRVAQRHLAIRKAIAEAGGIVPKLSDLRMTLLMRGMNVTVGTIRNDLVAMGWR